MYFFPTWFSLFFFSEQKFYNYFFWSWFFVDVKQQKGGWGSKKFPVTIFLLFQKKINKNNLCSHPHYSKYKKEHSNFIFHLQPFLFLILCFLSFTKQTYAYSINIYPLWLLLETRWNPTLRTKGLPQHATKDFLKVILEDYCQKTLTTQRTDHYIFIRWKNSNFYFLYALHARVSNSPKWSVLLNIFF